MRKYHIYFKDSKYSFKKFKKYYRNKAQRIVHINTYLNCTSSHIIYRWQ